MSKVSQKVLKKALEAYPSTPGWDEKITCMYRGGFIKGYHQAEKDIKEELSKLFQEFTLDCINDDKDIHILHFMDVFKNKLKEIGNE